MRKQACLNLILMFFLLAEEAPAQVGNFQLDQINTPVNLVSTYQRIGVMHNLPLFFNSAKNRLRFPLSWLSGSYVDFESWRIEARKTVKGLFLAEPSEAPFDSKIIDQDDRGRYVVNKSY